MLIARGVTWTVAAMVCFSLFSPTSCYSPRVNRLSFYVTDSTDSASTKSRIRLPFQAQHLIMIKPSAYLRRPALTLRSVSARISSPRTAGSALLRWRPTCGCLSSRTWLLARARPWPPPKPTGTDLSFLCDIRDTAVHSVHLVHLIATEASRLLRAAVSLLRAPEVGSVRDKLPDEVRQEVELTTKTMKSKAELLISIARDDFRAQREELRAKEKAKVAEILERACEPSGGG